MPRALLALLVLAALAAGGERPRLVVVVSVDQMRPDTLTRFAKEYTGGLKRLLEKGRQYAGTLDHRATETGPGHSTMLTGLHPSRTGIVANGWLDANTLKSVYCVGDDDSPVFGAKGVGRSPRNLLGSSLGEWLKQADARSKVYSVSGKDRAAILMGGVKADGAYWLERKGDGFTSSAWYHPDGRPDWLTAFNRDGWLDALPDHWTYEPVEGVRADDFPGESTRYSRTSPHPLKAGDRKKLLDRIYRSPYVDEWTVRLAHLLVERHDLGGDDAPDLLCISLSATDTAGHLYGPFSQEIRDIVLRVDRLLGKLFAMLDKRGAPYVVVLTADHGVLPIPDVNRIESRRTLQEIAVAMQKIYRSSALYRQAGSQIWIDRAKAKEKNLDPERVAEDLARIIVDRPEVIRVYDRAILRNAELAEDRMVALAQRSYHPKRSGDLVVVLKRNTILDFYGTGTTHGSPWEYDREVPLVFMGPGIVQRGPATPGRTVDIAPTLARILNIAAPSDLDGIPIVD